MAVLAAVAADPILFAMKTPVQKRPGCATSA